MTPGSPIWLSGGQVCELMGWKSVDTPRRVAKLRGWRTQESESSGQNGVKELQYDLNSLPTEAQLKYARSGRGKLSATSLHSAPAETLPLFASIPEPVHAPARVAVPDELRDQAAARYAAIEPLLDFRRRANGTRQVIRVGGNRVIRKQDELATYMGEQQHPPVCMGTIYGWLRCFDRGGYVALTSRPRKDKGQSHFFEEHPAAAALVQKKFLHEGLSRQMAWEAVVREWPKIEKKGEPPSYATVRNFLNALPEPMKVLAREGKEAHERKCSPFIQRGRVPVMDWWISDHRLFDVLVRNSLFAQLPAEKAFRLWFTATYDWGSRKIVGFCFAPTPSSRTINSSLRLGILSHGMPRNFYWDNGENYKKVRRDLELITLSDEAKALLERDRVGITSALPKRPRSKPIESWFSRWSKRFDVIWRPAYLGNKPGNCPEAGREAQKQHEDFLKGKRSDSPLPGDAEFIAATVQWIDEYNETRLEALDHRTPNEVMEEQHPERNRQAANPRLLDVLFSERVRRTVLAGGCVELDRMRYEPTDVSLFAMDVRKGRTVMILRDPYNLGEAVAADAETLQFVGELRIQQFVGQSPNGQITRDQIRAAMRRERSLRKGYAEYLAALQAIATNQGWKTEREALLERAGVRTGTDNRALLPAGAVPGRRMAELPLASKLSSPFVSDVVAEDADIWQTIELEDEDTSPVAAAPDARGDRALPPRVTGNSSPFVDDAPTEFNAAMDEGTNEGGE